MSWRPRRAQSLIDPAWRLLGAALVAPLVGLVASGNLLFPGDLETPGGVAWVGYQLLVVGGTVVGTRVALVGRWRPAALALVLAWIAAHIAYDRVLTDSFVRFGERVEIARPWVYGEALPIGAWLAGIGVVGGGLAMRGALDRARAAGPAWRRTALVGVATILRAR